MMRKLKKSLVGFFLAFVLMAPAQADITEVDNAALQALIAKGVAVVDVRRIDEWQATGVIDGAHMLTFFDKQGGYDADKWLQALDKIAPKGSPVVLICARGVRSKNIAGLLDKRLGYPDVHNHTLGMYNWIKSGMPTVTYAEAVADMAVDGLNTTK